uniref:Cytochrome P450 n=1 Tax=Anopheles quadriannulatus TaxID=34691 RepID=A0A182WRT8_ANOQN
MPFSAGSRNCIGQRYAMLEVKTVLVKLLANYQLLPCEANNQLRLKADMTLKPVNETSGICVLRFSLVLISCTLQIQ